MTVVAVGAAAGMLTRAPRLTPTASAPAPRVDEPLVSPVPSAPKDFLGVVLSGETVELAPKADGRLTAVLVKPGQKVKSGQVIAELDVHAVRQSLAVAEAALTDAQQRLERRNSVGAGVLSPEELSNAKMLVLEKRGRVDELRALINDARVRAPFDGVIASRYLDAGAMTGPSRPVARLLGAGDVRVRFAVPEDQSTRLVAGEHAQVLLKAIDRPLPAQVEAVAPEVDAAARMVFAVARLQVPRELAARLQSGMVATVRLDDVGEHGAR